MSEQRVCSNCGAPIAQAHDESRPKRWWLMLVIAAVVGVPVLIGVVRGGGEGAAERSLTVAPRVGAVGESDGIRLRVDDVVDPWTPDEVETDSEGSAFAPSLGRRFVAFDVTVENTNSEPLKDAYYRATLNDTNDFAYEETIAGPRPLAYSLLLNPGQKTRGWVVFEVDEEAQPDRLTLRVSTYDRAE